MATLTIVAADVGVHYSEQVETICLPALVALTAGQYCRLDPTTGKLDLGNATTAAEIGDGYIVSKSVAAGETATAVRRGLIDLGAALAALNFGANVFLSDTDGVLADTAGTVSKIVGRVVAVYGNGATPDKMLELTIN